MIKSKLQTANLQNKQVLVRADLNVFKHDDKQFCDFRLKKIIPTLKLIREKGGKIILIGHAEKESLQPLVNWFQTYFSTIFTKQIDHIEFDTAELILVENLRMFPGEKAADPEFAQKLKNLGDYFVQDAFGSLHRNHASITLLPLLFEPSNRTIGLLIEEELKHLDRFKDHPKRPYIAILGGEKIETKVPLIEHLIKQVDSVLIVPPLSFAFSKAQNISTGTFLINMQEQNNAEKILKIATQLKKQISLPIDYLATKATFQHPNTLFETNTLSSQDTSVSIGTETITQFISQITKAKTIFINAALGNNAYPETLFPLKKILDAVKKQNVHTIIGGGDTISYVQQLGFNEDIGFFSSGGGATLSYISGIMPIGLTPFR